MAGRWPSGSHAVKTAKMTSDSAANEASLGLNVRAAAIPVTSATAIATTARPTAGTSQFVRCPAGCTVPNTACIGGAPATPRMTSPA
jgi:hypothetical protein